MSGDPFRDMMEQVVAEILDGVEAMLESMQVSSESPETTLDPYQLYTAREAAEILNVDPSTMHKIPESELPKCRIGPSRGAARWLGADLLAYMKGHDPLDYESILEDVRNELRRVPGGSESPERGSVERVL